MDQIDLIIDQIDLIIDQIDLIIDRFLTSLMPSLLVDPQNPVSVIIRCKTVKTDTVENVRGITCQVSDEEWHHNVVTGGI